VDELTQDHLEIVYSSECVNHTFVPFFQADQGSLPVRALLAAMDICLEPTLARLRRQTMLVLPRLMDVFCVIPDALQQPPP
jgi:hypothetical protein